VTAVRAVLADATAALTKAGVGSPRVDAELLLAHVLGVERKALAGVDAVDAEPAGQFTDLVIRRSTREPLQYLTGEAPFRFAMIMVGPGVFIPRPETELLVDAVLTAARARPRSVVVDLCSGSGALALSLAHEVPSARVIAVEKSPEALGWLRRNAAGSQVQVVPGDVSDPLLLAELDGSVDVVVSNPPYVPTTTAVSAEVEHDPAIAVFAGSDGMALIPAVIAAAARLLRSGGVLAMEHDESQREAVLALLDNGQWTDAADHDDLTGRARYATATRAMRINGASQGKI
jgi:release factor glutamine methyltransferase